MCKESKKAEAVGIFKLLKIFPTDDSVLDYLESLIWSKGVHCNRCEGADRLTQQKDKHNYWCGSCRKYFNVRTNTPIENSNISLQKWMIAIYLFMTARKGINSLQLGKELDITQKSAWFMAQRIREMLTDDGNQTLNGIIEIDETYIGGLEKSKHTDKKVKHNQGRSTKTKTAVVGMKQRGGKVIAKSFDSA